MAVKSDVSALIENFRFLSRLCGGEEDGLLIVIHRFFLSRLCGGECVAIYIVVGIFFLSRLCGGEFCTSFYL